MSPSKSAVRAEAERLMAAFLARGAVPFETDILQPAGPLLDLYGEDIRARAFVTRGPDGEAMLRPDFTLPLVRRHPGGAARYAYAGEVFRRQEDGGRPTEYVQAGYEVFGQEDTPARDAEVLGALRAACGGLGAVTFGDIGLLTAAIGGLTTSARRRAMLLRHVWRPARFRALLARYARPADPPGPAPGGPQAGARTEEQVAERLRAIAEDAKAPPVPAEEAEALAALLALKAEGTGARAALDPLARALPGLGRRLPLFEARLAALEAATGLATLAFEATHARSAMEYYDGFTFTIAGPGAQPLAQGGRYDALTRAASEAATPAVGGIVRPAALIEARA